MAERELTTVYRAYLECLNERRWSDLGAYVAGELSYNGRRMTLGDYRAMLVADTHSIPDLRFDADIVVAADETVACRLFFRCTPVSTFLGIEPTGGPLSFAEHVFYRFDGGRIVEVWSVIDKESIREQVGA
jgi:predicted ester cyclase